MKKVLEGSVFVVVFGIVIFALPNAHNILKFFS